MPFWVTLQVWGLSTCWMVSIRLHSQAVSCKRLMKCMPLVAKQCMGKDRLSKPVVNVKLDA